jgi:hypothetical protein
MRANGYQSGIVCVARGSPFPFCCGPSEGLLACFLFLNCTIKKCDVFRLFGIKSRLGLSGKLGAIRASFSTCLR